MIQFSRREDYAIVIVGTLANAYAKRHVPLSEIANEYAISQLFLRNIANELREAGVITALEGKNGGYALTQSPEKIKMEQILGIFFQKRHVTCCSTNKDHTKNRICPKEKNCVAGNIWREINKEFIDKVYSLSLQEFLEYKKETFN